MLSRCKIRVELQLYAVIVLLLRPVVLKLVEGTEPRKFYAGIYRTPRWKLEYSQIKSVIILAALRRSV